MAAVTTKKPGSDLTIQLSFPTNFQDAYALAGPAEQYAPEAPMRVAAFPTGYDLQDAWHSQKMADAHRRVRNAVADTRRATNRALVSHQGYWAMPAPVLSQRVYANPSMGSGNADIYKPLHRATPELTGGVLRSSQGQEYGKKLLQARVAQINAIDEAAAGLQEGAPITDLSISQGLAEQPGIGPMFKLVSLLDNIIDSTETGISGINRFAMTDLTEFMALLFRVVPQLNEDELSNIQEGLEVAVPNAQLILDDIDDQLEAGNIDLGEDGEESNPDVINARARYAQTFARALKSALLYVYRMQGALELTPKERIAVSKNAIRTLKLNRWRTPAEARQLSEARDLGELRALLQGQGKARGGAVAVAPMSATFDRNAPTREDSEQGARGPRARFTIDERQVFGDNSGRWYGQTYQTAPEDGTAISHVANAAAHGVRNPFRAPGAAADARGDREFEAAAVREAPASLSSAADMRKGRMMASAAAQKAARDAAAASMGQIGMGRSKKWIQAAVKTMKKGAFTKQALRADHLPKEYAEMVLSEPEKHTLTTRRRAQFVKNVERPTRKEFNAALMRRVKSRGGSDDSKKKVLGKMEKDLGESAEVKDIMMPIDLSLGSLGKRKPSTREGELAMPGGEGKKPRAAKGPTPPKGKGKLRLINVAGKPHRGPYHQMEDGSYHSGAKHTKRSKPLTVAE